MTSEQLVAFVERKLSQHGIKKVVPSKEDLARAYRLFSQSDEAQKIIRRQLKKLNGKSSPNVMPDNLEEQVRQHLEEHPRVRWDAAVENLVQRKMQNGGGTR